MRSLQVIAVAEALFGAFLVAFPAQVVALLLGIELPATLSLAARIAGVGLILFAVACLRHGLVRSLLTYSAAALLALVLIGVLGGATGVLLWPAVAAHAVASAVLGRAVVSAG